MPPKLQALTPKKLRSLTAKFQKNNPARLVVASTVKAYFSSLGLRMSDDFIDQLTVDVMKLLYRAAIRAVASHCTTVVGEQHL